MRRARTDWIMRRARADGRGFALLIVLWALVLLSLVFTQIVAAGRGQVDLAANLRAGAMVRSEADGMLYQAIFHVLDHSPAGWPADGVTRTLSVPDGRAAITVVDLAGRINPNTASVPLLAALMAELGADRTTAQSVAQAIADWRTPDAQGQYGVARYQAAGLPYGPAQSAFQSLEELGLVLGMTPHLLALMTPHLSLANPDNPDPAQADPVVLRAMKVIGLRTTSNGAAPRQPRDILITVAVQDRSGARFVRRATVRLSGSNAYEMLSWDSPAWPSG